MNVREKALAFATKAHEGQFRKDGVTPYINHPIAVAEIALELYETHWLGQNIDAETNWEHESADTVYAVAVLHDVSEDTDTPIEIIKQEFGAVIADAIDKLTKRSGENYLSAILRAKTNDFSRLVKIADNRHNMSDLKEGSLKDKYRLSEYILSTYSGGPMA